MHKNIILTLFMCSCSFLGFAQIQQQIKVGGFDHTVFVGYNIGGLATVSFPNNIRKINSYSPSFSPSFGYELNYRLKEKWGITATAGFKLIREFFSSFLNTSKLTLSAISQVSKWRFSICLG